MRLALRQEFVLALSCCREHEAKQNSARKLRRETRPKRKAILYKFGWLRGPRKLLKGKQIVVAGA